MIHIFMSFTAADQLHPQRPTTAERGGMAGFYSLMGVLAALLGLLVIFLIVFRNKARRQNPVTLLL